MAMSQKMKADDGAGGAPRACEPGAKLGEGAAPTVRQTNEEAGTERPRERPAVAGAAAAVPAAPQRWHAQRKRDLVLRLLRGEALDVVSRETGVESYRLEEWKKRALASMET